MHMHVQINENVLAVQHLNVGRDEFQLGADGLPSKRQTDVWQGALRSSGFQLLELGSSENKLKVPWQAVPAHAIKEE